MIEETDKKLDTVDSILTKIGKILKKHWWIILILLISYFFYWALTSKDLKEYEEVAPVYDSSYYEVND